MSKRFLTSNDDTLYYDLPIASLDLSEEAATSDQTNINNTWSDEAATLKSWNASGDVKFHNEKGYNSKLLLADSSTSTTDESATNISGQIYQFQDISGEGYAIDTSTLVVYDDSTEVSHSDIKEFKPASGEVVFADDYTVTGPVTGDFDYYELTEVGFIPEITFDMSREEKDLSSIKACNANGGWMIREGGLKTLSISGTNIKVYGESVDFSTLINSDSLFFISVDLFNNEDFVLKTAVKITGNSISTSAGARVDESLTISPKQMSSIDTPASITINENAIEKGIYTVLNNFFFDVDLYCKIYDEDDSLGKEYRSGEGFISDVGLTINLNDVIGFSTTVSGSGKLEQTEIV